MPLDTNGSIEDYVDVELEKLAVCLALPGQIKKKANSALEMLLNHDEHKMISKSSAIVCAIYIAAIDVRMPYGPSDPQLEIGYLDKPEITVSDIIQKSQNRGDEFIECHLWDRHYGVKLETSILHRNCGQQSSGLNAVAFHPYDQETLVTAGDDRLLKVWRSKNRQAQIARGEYLGETLGLGVMDDFGRDLAEGDERTCGRISPTFNLLFDVKKKSSKK
uniref:Uncharacterized protein n=1 Tax=Magallana gigas TaxID=29159 RepID=K1RK56_MAGGI